ncbi:MAG: hypothetical protein FJ224_09425 [Lentisphaerae bacterium]|nr:hypothetical protein [Lentisphaerota bacterium]
MKMMSVLTVFIAFCCGCGRTETAGGNPTEKSSVQTAVDGFTGRTAVEAGKKARADIERISAQKNKDLAETYGEE